MIDSKLSPNQVKVTPQVAAVRPQTAGKSDTAVRSQDGSSRRGHNRTVRRAALGTMIVVLLAFVGVGAGFSGAITTETTRDPDQSRVLPVRTVQIVSATSYQVSRQYTGTIVARQTSELGFELAGKVNAIEVEEGDRVCPGDALARLDTRLLETERRQLVARRAQASARLAEMVKGPRDEDIAAARARVESLRAQVKLLQLQTDRQSRLLSKDATTRDAYDEFAYGLRTREAQLDEAGHNLEELLNGTRSERVAAQRAVVAELEAAIAEVDVNLDKSRLTAPFAGTVARRLIDRGTVVQSGQAILRIVEDGALEAWVGLPVQAAASMSLDAVYRLTIGAQTYDATVAGRFPEVDPATRTRTVSLRLDDSEQEHVVVGQVVRLSLDESVSQPGYWLPLAALAKGSRGLWTTFVAVPELDIENEFTVERRHVEVLHTQSDRVFVRGTLNTGDRVIDAGAHRIVTGQRVRPIDHLAGNGRETH